MGKYNLDRLGNEEFENLVQALSMDIFNNQSIIFGSGRDGAREATFDGESTMGSGYHVIQAKFKDSFESKDFEWLKGQFKKEIKKFKDKKRDLPTPEIYVFFTNVTLTPVSKVGGRDEIEEFKKEYNKFIPNIIIYGKDEIYKLLDNNRDVATTYASFIFSGDIISELYSHLEISKSRDNDILFRFLNKEFEENLYSKLEQAGKVTDEPVNLDKVFVDLNISGDNLENLYEDKNEKFVSFCLEIGNKTWKKEQYKMVFKGGPGQGKSTVTQFLTQIYRVSFLNTFKKKTLSSKIKSFEKQVDKDMQPKCYRFPINIILSDYSEWLNEQKNDNKSCSVLSYIQYRIEYRADQNFSEFNNFRELLQKLSFIFIFDGLDEVPATSNRKDVIYEIDNFINHELKTVNCDALIIATTRPQGYSNEFSREKKFKHFKLDDLDKDTCIQYLEALVKNTINSNDESLKQLKILKDALENEVTANIMKTPLQATIMAILVKSGGKPSKDKFSLFDDYYKTMLKREKQKNVLKIIGENEKFINEIHYKLGNRLQVSSQEEENSSAYLDIDSFRELVEKYFDEKGLSIEDKTKYTTEIMDAITERLVFITENQDGKIGFAIRSTQEYFSAMKNVHNIREKKVIQNTKIISENSYWRNVFIFMLGHMMINKEFIIDENLDSYIGELNGSALDCNKLSLSSVPQYGSQLSLEILAESILSNSPKLENKFIKHLNGLTKTFISNNDNYKPLLQKLKLDIFDRGFSKILKNGVDSKELYIRMSSWNMIAMLSEKNLNFMTQFEKYWIFEEGEEELYYLNLFVENNVYSQFILEKYSKYLNWNYFDDLSDSIELIDKVSKLDSIYFTKDIKNFVIEFLFLNRSHHSHYEKAEKDKLFFELLEIKTDETLDSLKNEEKVLTDYKFKIKPIKDLKKNQLLNDLYAKTAQDEGLEFLSIIFNYLLNPSSETLKKCFNAIKLKQKIVKNRYFHSLDYNWQLVYLNKNSNHESFSIENFGSTFQECIEYEEKIMNLNNIFNNIEFFSIQAYRQNLTIFDFYEKIYLQNKSKLSIELLVHFVNNARNIDTNFNKEKFEKILDEILVIIKNNDNSTYSMLFSIVLVLVISFIKEEKLLKFTNINYERFSKTHILHFGGDSSNILAVRKIINMTNFIKKENNLIVIAFYLLNSGSMRDNMDLNILLELEYKNKELQLFGYLLSLVDETIHINKDKMKMITTFLLSNVKNNNETIEYTLNILKNNNIKSDLAIKLLFEMYKCIKKDSIESCLLASRYESYFKDVFETRVIEFED